MKRTKNQLKAIATVKKVLSILPINVYEFTRDERSVRHLELMGRSKWNDAESVNRALYHYLNVLDCKVADSGVDCEFIQEWDEYFQKLVIASNNVTQAFLLEE